MKKLIVILFVFVSSFGFTQNLVPNPSFEVLDTCPDNGGQIYFSPPWYQPSFGTTDFFHACSPINYGIPDNVAGYETAHTGLAYAGIVTFGWSSVNPIASRNYREYIQVELIETLTNEVEYCIEFYVSLADSALYSANNIGLYLSDTAILITSDTVMFVIPQISNPDSIPLTNKNGWTKVSGRYIASGNEKFITIGNFNVDSLTDTTNMAGASYCTWAIYYVDDISIIPCDSLTRISKEPTFINHKIYPNPTTGKIRIKTDGVVSVEVINIQGELVLSKKTKDKNQNHEIDLSSQPKGIYIIKVTTSKGVVVEKVILH